MRDAQRSYGGRGLDELAPPTQLGISGAAQPAEPAAEGQARGASMRKLGDWVRFLAVSAAYGVAFFLFRRASPLSVESPWFVCTAMICFLGLAAVARPVVRIRMPRSLRRIRAWEVEGGFYRTLRVPAFGILLRRTPLRLLNRDVYLGAGDRDRVKLGAQLEAAEASHFWAALLVVPYLVHAWLLGAWSALLWVSLTQVPANAYPVMHLRLTRYRLDRLISKKSLPRHRTD